MKKESLCLLRLSLERGDTKYVHGGVGGNYPVDGCNFYVKVGDVFVRLK